MRPLPLKTQYIIGICSLILGVSVALLLYTSIEFNKRLENELHKRGTSIARALAEDSFEPIITENYVDMQLRVNDLKGREADIHYIYIVTNRQQIAAHTFGSKFPRDLLKTDRPDMNVANPLIQTLQIGQEQLKDVSVAIQHGEFGRVHIGMSEESLKAEQREMILNNAPIIAVILLMGSVGAWWFAGRITKPVAALAEGVRNVAEGRLGVSIDNRPNNEIGELARAFNKMVINLQNRTTEQLEAENKLRLQTALLGVEVTERQITQEELSVKQSQLESLNRLLEKRINSTLAELRMKDRVMLAQGRQAAMGEMINNIAHQWRQPLNNLGLIVQNLKTDYDCGTLTPEMLKNDVDNVMNTIMFMSQTINDFSNFFSPDSAKKVFYISQGLSKVIAMIEASLSKKGIQIVVEQEEEEVTVEGFFNEYNQVLLNILNNAHDALHTGRVEQPVIKISIKSEERQAIVRVCDNAGGIPDDVIEQIFDPYFTTKEHGKGSGIGLYMSKTIIQEHFGGTLTVANVDGGAEFTVSTPCAKDKV